MPVDLIIDGYNLMHFAGLARDSYGPGDLQRARQRLLIRLTTQLTRDEIRRTIVVFDAADMPAGQVREDRFRKLQVIYSDPGQEADDVIEDLIAQHASPKQLAVVSSDNRLLRAIRRRKGLAITSEAFLDELEKPRDTGVSTEADVETEPPPLAEEDVNAWLKEFGMEAESYASTVSAGLPESPKGIEPPSIEIPIEDQLPADAMPTLLDELEEELRRCLEEDD